MYHVLFVYGPLDGQRRMLPEVPVFRKVAMPPRVATAPHGERDQVILEPQEYTYALLQYRKQHYYVPAYWLEAGAPGDPFDLLFGALVRGYVGAAP